MLPGFEPATHTGADTYTLLNCGGRTAAAAALLFAAAMSEWPRAILHAVLILVK